MNDLREEKIQKRQHREPNSSSWGDYRVEITIPHLVQNAHTCHCRSIAGSGHTSGMPASTRGAQPCAPTEVAIGLQTHNG